MDLIIVTVRIGTIIPLLILMTLLMGKRQVGELPVLDFVIAITIGSVAGADIADINIPHLPTAFAIIVLGIFQFIVSYGKISSRLFNHYLTFEPTIVIQNGQIVKKHLKKIRYTLDNLLELLRLKGVFNINEVEFAIIEANGKLSVLRKSQYEPPTAQDLKVKTDYQGVMTPLIVEGKVFPPGLHYVGLDEQWVVGKINEQGYKGVNEIFFAALNVDGTLHISPEQDLKKEQIFRF